MSEQLTVATFALAMGVFNLHLCLDHKGGLVSRVFTVAWLGLSAILAASEVLS